jgi:predicted nucleic acid-binding protein
VIVVDASLALKLVLDEADSDEVRLIWTGWTNDGEILCAPTLFRPETNSAVQRRVYRGELTDAQGRHARAVLRALPVEFREPANLYEVAWEYAERFNRPAIYDSCYLALADIFGCEFWTADRRLANAAQALPWVRVP